MTTTNIKPASSKILKMYYTDASVFTGYENYGENPPIATLKSTGVWKQLRCESGIAGIVFAKDAFMTPQYSSEILSDTPQIGLEKPEITVDQLHTAEFLTRHSLLLGSGFGTPITCTGDTTISTVTDDDTIIVAAATNFDEGDIVKITSATDVFKGYAEIEDITSTTFTLKNPVSGMLATDKVIGVTSYNTRLTADDKYYHLFIESDIGNFFVYWCKPSISLTTPLNEQLKISVKFQGDSTVKTTEVFSGFTNKTTDVVASLPTIANFKKAIIGADVCRSITSSNFTLTRENVRIASQCSDSMQGNGGSFNTGLKDGMVEVELLKYTDNYASYVVGSGIKIAAYNEKFAIFGDGKISNLSEFNEIDMQVRPKITVMLNAIEGKPIKVVI